MVNVSKILMGVAVCSVLGSVTLMAGSHNKHNKHRKGKPFVKINEQLVEISGAITSLQDQVDLLVARVDTVEQRAAALEVAVADMEANNAVLEAMISQNATDITSVNQAISTLQADNAALQLQVDANDGDIQSANDTIAANAALILALQSAIIELENGSVAADADLQVMIESNQALIITMQGEIDSINQGLALKQNIIAGTCPNGEAVIGVGENSISCGTVGGTAGSISVYTTLSYDTIDIPIYDNAQGAKAICQDGDLLIGGGFLASEMNVYYNGPDPEGSIPGWYVVANNPNSYSNDIYAIAQCMRIN